MRTQKRNPKIQGLPQIVQIPYAQSSQNKEIHSIKVGNAIKGVHAIKWKIEI